MGRILWDIFYILALMMMCKAEESDEVDDSCDFIIVGAGTASLALAGQLALVPHWKVCVFESGPMEHGMVQWRTGPYQFSSPHDPGYFTQPVFATNVGSAARPYNKNKDGRILYIARFRGRGGTSRVYATIPRFASPAVLDLWPNGWTSDQFTKYYKKVEDHYCYYDTTDSSGLSPEECEELHGKGGAMQLNPQIKEAFRKFPREMLYLCEDTTKPWKGYTADYNGAEEARTGCSAFQKYELRIKDNEPTDEARRNRASKTARGSSYSGYYQYRNTRPYLVTSAPVTKIFFEDGKAVGVAYLDVSTNKIRKQLAKKEVIIGGGSFDTPHLLQLSGVGPRDLLENIGVDVVAENEHVGQHLWDHLSVPYVLKLRKDSEDLCCITNETYPTVDIDGTIYKTKELDDINGPFSWIFHYRSNVTRTPQKMTDVQLYVIANSKLFDNTGPLCTPDSPQSAETLEDHEAEFQDDENDEEEYNEGTIRIVDQWPEYRGSVNATTANIFDLPKVEYGWNYTLNGVNTANFEQVSKLFRDQVRLLRSMFFGADVSPELRNMVLDEVEPGLNLDTDEELNAWMRGIFVSALHPLGTCKMPECADEFLQVNGVTNLRICDASAFATNTDGNPSATLYAMGEKLSDMLKFQYLKYINIVVRAELSITGQTPTVPEDVIKEMIQTTTDCFETQVSFTVLSTGKGTFALITKIELICSEDVNERDVADKAAERTLSLIPGGCGANGYPLFNRDEASLPPRPPSPKHEPSPHVFLVWCQSFPDVSPDDLWAKAGKWHGSDGRNPGSVTRYKLDCQTWITQVLKYVDDTARELIYTEPEPDADIVATKKVLSRQSGESSVFMRTDSFISAPGDNWYAMALFVLENVFQSSGIQYSREFPPLSNHAGWWTQRSDGLLIYETKDIQSHEDVASFDLRGTLINTKSGLPFPQDENDWVYTTDNVKSILEANNNANINNVVMSNNLRITEPSNNKLDWMNMIEKVTADLAVPMYVLAATKKNHYKKPNTGMWDYYSCNLRKFNSNIDKAASVYVGNAAGRPGDHTDNDRMFAENVGLPFQTNTEYFPTAVQHQQQQRKEL